MAWRRVSENKLDKSVSSINWTDEKNFGKQ